MTTQIFKFDTEEQFKIAQKSIFRPIDEKEGKFKRWIKIKMQNYIHNSSPEMKRYLRIHHWAKRKLFQNGIKIFRKVLGKYIIRNDSDIPKEWYNNHLRILYNSFMIGLKDTWKHMVWNMPGNNTTEYHKKFKNNQDYYFQKAILDIDHWSFCNRRDIIGIWFTEILEDTFDREWINMTLMRATHEMMEYYGVSEAERAKVPKPGQYPMWLSRTQHNPAYQIGFANHPIIGRIWEPKEVIEYGKKGRSKKSRSKCKRGPGSKTETEGKSPEDSKK